MPRRTRNLSGFTLLELLLVISIVSALSAIAIPQYKDYRKKAYDIRTISDLRTIAMAEEAYFMAAERYLSCVQGACEALPGVAALSKGVELSVQATTTGFVAQARHEQGSKNTFTWDSGKGGLQ